MHGNKEIAIAIPICMAYYYQIFVVAAFLSGVLSQQCPHPTSSQIESLLSSYRKILSEVGPATIIDARVTASAIGTLRETYREVAIAVKYTTTGALANFTAHLQAGCSGGTTYDLRESEANPPNSAFTVAVRTDCRRVSGPSATGQSDYDPVTNCLGELTIASMEASIV